MNNAKSRSVRMTTPLVAALMAATALTAMPLAAVAKAPDAPSQAVVETIHEAAKAVVAIDVMRSWKSDEVADAAGDNDGDLEMHEQMISRSQTTGFILSADGEIVTSAAAVEGASQIRVLLNDGQVLDAHIIGADGYTDIAVLKVEASGLPTVAFAAPDSLKVGSPVMAVGASHGARHMVTTGVISSLGAEQSGATFDDLLVSDASVGRGNVGGPLLNADGQVVAVNAQRFTSPHASDPMSVALSAGVAQAVVTDLADDGHVDRGFLGVQIMPVGEDVALALGLDSGTGALVTGVGTGTPAETAGLHRGDVVLSVNGTDIRTPQDLTRSIAGDAPGAQVAISVLRAGQPLNVSATLGNRADQKA
ncbi:MAG: trypsin-like peptidase domain-containing protein [Pseudomonadota bacterium]|nr:trypsin-like peptidase domain-containing protein [Pseudomonadota bacterium]